MKKNVVMDKSFDFALSIIELYKQLVAEKEYVISNNYCDQEPPSERTLKKAMRHKASGTLLQK